ncbi:MAG TPA: hypothetical protein PK705_06320 [Clostridia bacterium]|nr:hypothetical protein [Clostridia bacterium]
MTQKSTDELIGLLREALVICREDRKIAKDNYNSLRSQLDDILARDMESSEDGKIEQEVNRALKLVFDSGNRMESVITTITKILVTQLTNESREKVAQSVFGGGGPGLNGRKIIDQPVDLKGLLTED